MAMLGTLGGIYNVVKEEPKTPQVFGTAAGCGTRLISGFYAEDEKTMEANILSAWRQAYDGGYALVLAITGYTRDRDGGNTMPVYAPFDGVLASGTKENPQAVANRVFKKLGWRQVTGFNIAGGHTNSVNTMWVWARPDGGHERSQRHPSEATFPPTLNAAFVDESAKTSTTADACAGQPTKASEEV